MARIQGNSLHFLLAVVPDGGLHSSLQKFSATLTHTPVLSGKLYHNGIWMKRLRERVAMSTPRVRARPARINQRNVLIAELALARIGPTG